MHGWNSTRPRSEEPLGKRTLSDERFFECCLWFLKDSLESCYFFLGGFHFESFLFFKRCVS